MKTLFLDRDGVLNPLVEQEGGRVSPQHPDQFELLPGVEEALQDAKEAGFQLIVFTNQPDVEKPWRALTQERLDTMHAILREKMVDAVYACTHGPRGSEADPWYREEGEIVTCDCRKPRPGLLERAVADHAVTVPASYVIGDQPSDIEAARRFEEERGERFAGRLGVGGQVDGADRAFYNLPAAVGWIREDGTDA